MAIKITLKNSVVQDSVPTTSHLAAVGELALNANINSLGIYMRASDNSIVKMAGPGSVTTPAASVTAAGIAELATSAETTTGTDTARVTTPAGVKAVTDAERTTSNNTYLAKAGGTLTGVVAATAGSNSAPAIHFGDSDSGIYGGTNTVSLAAGGTQGLTLNANAEVNIPVKLGVNTASPTKALHVTSTGEVARFQSTNSVAGIRLYSTASDYTELGHTGDFYVVVGGSERARVDSSGRMLVGHSSSLSNGCLFQVARTNDNTVELFGFSANTNGARVNFTKSRNGTIGTNTIVQSGDTLGQLIFSGADGTGYIRGASIQAKVDGTPGTDDMPGRLEFSTTADGASTQSTRLTIDSAGVVSIPDNGKFTAGASSDLSLYHDSTYSNIKNTNANGLWVSSDLTAFANAATSENLAKFIADGAVELYWDGTKKFETTSTGAKFTGDLRADDDYRIKLGTSQETTIFHHNTGIGGIENTAHNLILRAKAGEEGIIVKPDAAVELYWDGNKKLETYQYGVTVTGNVQVGTHAYWGDDGEAIFGDGSDLKIYHDGSHSYISDIGTGDLVIKAQNFNIHAANGTSMAYGVQGAQFELYHGGSKKLFTSTNGAVVESGTANFEIYSSTDDADATLSLIGKTPSGGVGQAGIVRIIGESTSTNNGSSSLHLQTRTSGNAVTTALTINASQQVWIGSTAQYGPNAYNLADKGVAITAAGENVLKVLDSTSYASDVGGAILLGGNYRSTGDTQPFVELKSFKENGTDTDYAYGFRIGTTPNGGSITERLRIDSTGKCLIERTVSDTSGVHPALQIETTSSGTENSSFATGIDFFQDGIHKKRLAITKGNAGTGGGDWAFYKDQGNNVHTYMTADGDMSIADGNLKLASSHGINFHDYGSGTDINSNLLDDYEEGSYTPTLPGESTSNADGTYTKIGNVCVFCCSFTCASTSSTSHYQVTLPFTPAGGRSGCGVVRYSTSPNWNEVSFHVNAGGTSASLYELSGGAVTYASQDTYRFDVVFIFRTA